MKKAQTVLTVMFWLFLFFVLWMGLAGWVGQTTHDAVSSPTANLSALERVVYGNINIFIALGFLVSCILVGKYAFF